MPFFSASLWRYGSRFLEYLTIHFPLAHAIYSPFFAIYSNVGLGKATLSSTYFNVPIGARHLHLFAWPTLLPQSANVSPPVRSALPHLRYVLRLNVHALHVAFANGLSEK